MNQILPTTLISRVAGLLVTEVDGESVLMHVERSSYYGLARSAHRVWSLLEAPCSFADLCQQLGRLYTGPAADIEADTKRFLLQMAEEGLVTLK
jgi:hypothetical protein